MTDGDLHDACTPAGADLRASREGGLVRLLGLTERAQVWIDASLDLATSVHEGAAILELRYFPAIADAIIASGMTFEPPLRIDDAAGERRRLTLADALSRPIAPIGRWRFRAGEASPAVRR